MVSGNGFSRAKESFAGISKAGPGSGVVSKHHRKAANQQLDGCSQMPTIASRQTRYNKHTWLLGAQTRRVFKYARMR